MTDPLPVEALRWVPDVKGLPFETTAEVEPVTGVVGQSTAVEALQFGIECGAPGQNIFVRGLVGTGRMTLVAQLLDELKPVCDVPSDYAYVHNFARPDRPRLLTLPPRRARPFRKAVSDLAEFVSDGLGEALTSETVRARKKSLERRQRDEVDGVAKPFERALRDAGLALVSLQVGPAVQPAVFPMREGKPVPPEEFDHLHESGEVSAEEYASYAEKREAFEQQLQEITVQVQEIRRRRGKEIRGLMESTARSLLADLVAEIHEEFPGEDVKGFLSEVVDDVVENRLEGGARRETDPHLAYGVNIVLEHHEGDGCPIVIENTPTLANLLGTVQREFGPDGRPVSDYRAIRGGSLLRAAGGYLILDARELVREQGAWKVLVRTLRTGSLEIVPPEMGWPFFQSSVKPEAVPLDIRVILTGDEETYYLLDSYDPDFSHLFKVLADFDTTIAQEPDGLERYAGVLARIAAKEGLAPFHRSAVGVLAAHGARVAAREGRLTARFGRIVDIAREAAFLAGKEGLDRVDGRHVEAAISRTKSRAGLSSRKFQEFVKDGTILVRVDGLEVGQINGLAVVHAGPITYGLPARITATIGAGNSGVIDIEESASLSGAIHTKGFGILGGLLRHLLDTDHPLAFSASVAFEQSYGGIDGDSASGAEICCLLSALTGVPIRQGFAMTGAIDQHGRIQAIGGVNEKIEGFFDCCEDLGLTGQQGVLIPRSNAGDLQLRADVVDACGDGRFAIHAVESVHEALELLTGVPAGRREAGGEYPEGTLLRAAMDRAREFWLRTLRDPSAYAEDEEEEEGQGEAGEDGEQAG